MATAKASDLLADLPLEITLSILERLEWRETLPLRRVNKQWCGFIDHYFVKADFYSSQFWEKGKFRLREASRYTRNLCIDGRFLSGRDEWSALARQCPRISVLHVSFDNVKTSSFLSFVSNLASFRFLAVLTLENTRYRQIHELLPSLQASCPSLQDLRIHVLPINWKRMRKFSWLEEDRVVHAMPQLRSLDLEFVLMYECYDCHCCGHIAIEKNAQLHRPLIKLVAAANDIAKLRIGVTYHKNSGSSLMAYAPCIALLHKTHLKLREAVFENLELRSTPALAAESLTLLDCSTLVNPGREASLAYNPTAEEIWYSKLKYFRQVDGWLEAPLTQNIRELEINGPHSVERLVQKLRARDSSDSPLLSLKSLRLNGSVTKWMGRHDYRHPEDLKYTDLKLLVKAFPNLKKLILLDQIDVGIIEIERDMNPNENELTSAETERTAEYLGPHIPWEPDFPEHGTRYRREYPHLRDLNDLGRETELDRARRKSEEREQRQGFKRADPEAYLRANLPRLKSLTIK